MAETAPLRDAAREEFEAEQMEMEDEWLVRGSSSPAPTATQVIVLCQVKRHIFPPHACVARLCITIRFN